MFDTSNTGADDSNDLERDNQPYTFDANNQTLHLTPQSQPEKLTYISNTILIADSSFSNSTERLNRICSSNLLDLNDNTITQGLSLSSIEY